MFTNAHNLSAIVRLPHRATAPRTPKRDSWLFLRISIFGVPRLATIVEMFCSVSTQAILSYVLTHGKEKCLA